MANFELFSVIKDGIEIGTVGCYDDAQSCSPETTFVFIDKPKPTNVLYNDWEEKIENIGYYIDSNEA